MTTKCGGTCCGGDHKCTCEVSEFKRELRYVVFKLKDIKKYLHPIDQQILMELGNRIAKGRREDVKPPFNAVVVERDWPEFEMVWAAIEARMTPNVELRGAEPTGGASRLSVGLAGKENAK